MQPPPTNQFIAKVTRPNEGDPKSTAKLIKMKKSWALSTYLPGIEGANSTWMSMESKEQYLPPYSPKNIEVFILTRRRDLPFSVVHLSFTLSLMNAAMLKDLPYLL